MKVQLLLTLALLFAGCAGTVSDDRPATAASDSVDERAGAESSNSSVPAALESKKNVTDPAAEPKNKTLPKQVEDKEKAKAKSPHVVVAVIDSGVNVYHDAFSSSGLSKKQLAKFVDESSGDIAKTVKLTSEGSYEDRVAADQGLWDNMELETLYYFEGTNILGISFDRFIHWSEEPLGDPAGEVPVLDDNGTRHGTWVAAAVLEANPEAVVVMVEGYGEKAENWVANQPWIDIVSLSYGPIVQVPGAGVSDGPGTHERTKLMANAGMLPVGAAQNTPESAANDETAGPPWMVAVAGDHEGEGCKERDSAQTPDFTASYTQYLPRAYKIDEYQTVNGNSFAAPTVAGVFSQMLLEVRTQWNYNDIRDGAVLARNDEGEELQAQDLVNVVQKTARYFEGTCDETTNFDPQDPRVPRHLPVPAAAPFVQMGWGHVGPELVSASVTELLGGASNPEKSDLVIQFQAAQMAYREAVWGSS